MKGYRNIIGYIVLLFGLLATPWAIADDVIGLLDNYRQERANGISYAIGNWSYNTFTAELSVTIDRSTYIDCGPYEDFSGTVVPTLRGFNLLMEDDVGPFTVPFFTLRDGDPDNPVLGTHLVLNDEGWHIVIMREGGRFLAIGSCEFIP